MAFIAPKHEGAKRPRVEGNKCQRRFDRVKRSQLANHVLSYVCMGVLISPLYPSYLATKVSLSCFSSCLILVRALYPS